jgi:hypothetical protein
MQSYKWRATLDDGTVINQFDKSGEEVSSSHLDAQKVEKMELIPQTPGRQPITLLVDLLKGERFIRFWRKYNTSDGRAWTKWVIGLQKTVEGKNVKFFVYLNHDGTINISSDGEL